MSDEQARTVYAQARLGGRVTRGPATASATGRAPLEAAAYLEGIPARASAPAA